ncbi:acyl-CoA dehydrogenase [Acrasis kona]|uniref:Acyl-CoA dehydrogenase n=1 Tax=Acrasis kona TaxID=1008807 RepID=A0AAW2YV03_9EUKA
MSSSVVGDKSSNQSLSQIETLRIKFDQAVEAAKDVNQTNDQKLELYSLYKQATAGPLRQNKPKIPSVLDVVGRAKYYSWQAHNGMNEVEAMEKYIELVNQLAPDRMFAGIHKKVTQTSGDEKLIQGIMNMDDLPQEQRIDIQAVSRYIADNVQDFNGPVVGLRPFVNSQSNPTFYLQASDGQEYVLRKKPHMSNLQKNNTAIPNDHQLSHPIEREYRIMKTLAQHTNIPVPRVYCLCLDSSIIGTPFYLMDYVEGRIFNDPSLPDVDSAPERFAIYNAYNDMIAKLHSLDYKKLGLHDFGRTIPESTIDQDLLFCERQIARLKKQNVALKSINENYQLSDFDKILSWLESEIKKMSWDAKKRSVTIIHGDLRLCNMVFDQVEPKIVAILDWELSTLGSPLLDLAFSCLPYHTIPEYWPLRGLYGTNLMEQGIPNEREFVNAYCKKSNTSPIDHWKFYIVLAFAKGIAHAQLMQHHVSVTSHGNSVRSSDPGAVPYYMRSKKSLSVSAKIAAAFAWKKISGGELSPVVVTPLAKLLDREHVIHQFDSCLQKESFSRLYDRVWSFMHSYIIPNEHIYSQQLKADPYHTPPVLYDVMEKAKEMGLFNFWAHHVRNHKNVSSYTTVRRGNDAHIGTINTSEFCLLMEVAGRSDLSIQALNCHPIDMSIMMTLRSLGTEKQRVELLESMMDGKIKTCLAVTTCQDALCFTTRIKMEQDEEQLLNIVNGSVYCLTALTDKHEFLMVPRSSKSHALIRINSETVEGRSGVIKLKDAVVFDFIQSPNSLVLEFSWYCVLLAKCDEIFRSFCKQVKIQSTNRSIHYKVICKVRIRIDSSRLLLVRAASDIDRLGVNEEKVLKRNLNVVKIEIMRLCGHVNRLRTIFRNIDGDDFDVHLNSYRYQFITEECAGQIENIAELELLRSNL